MRKSDGMNCRSNHSQSNFGALATDLMPGVTSIVSRLLSSCAWLASFPHDGSRSLSFLSASSCTPAATVLLKAPSKKVAKRHATQILRDDSKLTG